MCNHCVITLKSVCAETSVKKNSNIKLIKIKGHRKIISPEGQTTSNLLTGPCANKIHFYIHAFMFKNLINNLN